MKNKKDKSTLIKDAIALFLITLVSGLALSFVYEITLAPIQEQRVIKTEKANKAVFMEADSFEADQKLEDLVAAKGQDLTALNADFKGITIDSISKALSSDKELLGYNITVSTSQGYKDVITLVMGYSSEGEILGIEMIALSETPGLGMNAGNPSFINQFTGKTVNRFEITKTGATKEAQIDAISSATITSSAVVNAVNAGMSFVTEYATELGGGANE